jgi:hypothetical protein
LETAVIAVLASLVTLWLAAAPAQPMAGAAPHLVYDIIVTQPGTRSQGWHGLLYGDDTALDAQSETALAVPAGWRVITPLGTFVSVACLHAWSACGMIREDMAAWLATGPTFNTLGGEAWVFRVIRVIGPDGAEQWQGQLLRDGAAVLPTESPVATPMGPFIVGGQPVTGAVWSGWAPESWTAIAP